MSLTKIVATFAFVITLTVAFSSSNEVQAQSGSRGGGIASGVAGSGSRALPAVSNFGGGQSVVSGPVEYSSAPVSGFSSAPIEQYSSGTISSPVVSSGCGCGAPAPAPVIVSAPAPCCSAPAPAPQPIIANPCGGGCGGCGGGCGGGSSRGMGARLLSRGGGGGLFQRSRGGGGCGCN